MDFWYKLKIYYSPFIDIRTVSTSSGKRLNLGTVFIASGLHAQTYMYLYILQDRKTCTQQFLQVTAAVWWLTLPCHQPYGFNRPTAHKNQLEAHSMPHETTLAAYSEITNCFFFYFSGEDINGQVKCFIAILTQKTLFINTQAPFVNCEICINAKSNIPI